MQNYIEQLLPLIQRYYFAICFSERFPGGWIQVWSGQVDLGRDWYSVKAAYKTQIQKNPHTVNRSCFTLR